MKNYSKYFIPTLSLLIIFFFPLMTMAQGDPGGDPGVPFDGGASLVIAAGAAYGVKKYRERKKIEKSEESESQ